MKKPGLKWSPAVAIRKADNILSSKVRESGQKGFTPSYENESKCNMNFIMSNEYLRIWQKERALYEVDTYSKDDVGASNYKRRYVQRKVSKSRNKEEEAVLPSIQLKKFANVKAVVDNKLPNAIQNQKQMKKKESPLQP